MTQDVRLEGVLQVLPTPFDSSGKLVPADIRRGVTWAVECGVQGVVVLGVASEVFRLSDSERQAVVEATTLAADGRVPVVVGAGHLSTSLASSAARAAVVLGASALLVAPPPVGIASELAITDYFAAIADEVDVPIVLHDDPVHLGVGLSVAEIVRLSEQQANCQFAKLEELPSMNNIRAVIEGTNGRVSCLGGSGGVYFMEELAAGATGIMTGFAFPEGLVALYEAWKAGNRVRARAIARLLSGLARLESLPKASLSIRKRLYHARGVLSNPDLRAPAYEVDDWTWQLAESELQQLEADWEVFDGRTDAGTRIITRL